MIDSMREQEVILNYGLISFIRYLLANIFICECRDSGFFLESLTIRFLYKIKPSFGQRDAPWGRWNFV